MSCNEGYQRRRKLSCSNHVLAKFLFSSLSHRMLEERAFFFRMKFFFFQCRCSPVATGVFGGLSPPKQSSKPPQIETWNAINQWSFCQFLECQVPPYKCKAPLLQTFWRRFCADASVTKILRANWNFVWFRLKSDDGVSSKVACPRQ